MVATHVVLYSIGMRYLCCALVIPACLVPRGVDPHDLPSLGISVEAFTAPGENGMSHIAIILGYDDKSYLEQHGECAVVSSDEVAMFDQTPVPLTFDGETFEEDQHNGDCSIPEFETNIALGTTGAHHVTVSGNIAMDFADGQVVARTATPVFGDWVLTAGQSFTVQWSTPSDLALIPNDAFHISFEALSLDWFPLEASAGSDTLTLAVPAGAIAAGSGALDISVAWTGGSAATCTGATECTYMAVAEVWHTATLQSPPAKNTSSL